MKQERGTSLTPQLERNLRAFHWLKQFDHDNIFQTFTAEDGSAICKINDCQVKPTEAARRAHAMKHERQRAELRKRAQADALKQAQKARRLKNEAKREAV